MKKSNVVIYTSEFENVHGKKPRGFGIWNFYFGYKGKGIDGSFTGLFSKAVKLMKIKASKKCYGSITVLP